MLPGQENWVNIYDEQIWCGDGRKINAFFRYLQVRKYCPPIAAPVLVNSSFPSELFSYWIVLPVSNSSVVTIFRFGCASIVNFSTTMDIRYLHKCVITYPMQGIMILFLQVYIEMCVTINSLDSELQGSSKDAWLLRNIGHVYSATGFLIFKASFFLSYAIVEWDG